MGRERPDNKMRQALVLASIKARQGKPMTVLVRTVLQQNQPKRGDNARSANQPTHG